MLPRRHSPVAITLGITALLLSPGLFFLTEAQTYDIDSFSQSQGEQQYRQCMIQAVNAYENERLQAYRQYHDALENGYQQRLQDVQQAWQIPDSRTRSNALRDIDREFRTFERDLSRAHKERLREASRMYKDARRDCDDDYRQWKREARDAQRAFSQRETVDFSTYPDVSYGDPADRYDDRYDDRYRDRTGPAYGRSTYPAYDQAAYYDALLDRARKQRQLESYRHTQTTSAVTRTYGAQTNIRCGDGICQEGELNVCSYDCVAYPERSDDSWYSTYVDGYGYVAPVQLQY